MVDYTFYKTVYLGSAIPEKAFPGVATQAEGKLQMLKRVCRVTASGKDSEKMALCAMAEAIYAHTRKGGVKSTSIGGVQVSYETLCPERAVYDAAGIYLDVYRGVGVC